MTNLLLSTIVAVIAVVPATTSAAPAADGVFLGEPAYGGTGCPQGTVNAVLSNNARTLSLLFDAYVAENEAGSRLARASCSVAIPVQVPPGRSVSLVRVDYRGFADIPSGATGVFSAEYFFAGDVGPTSTMNFPANYTSEFYIADQVQPGASTWSGCGQDVNLRMYSRIRVRKNQPNGEDGYMAIDSADWHGGVQYQLAWRNCAQ